MQIGTDVGRGNTTASPLPHYRCRQGSPLSGAGQGKLTWDDARVCGVVGFRKLGQLFSRISILNKRRKKTTTTNQSILKRRRCRNSLARLLSFQLHEIEVLIRA